MAVKLKFIDDSAGPKPQVLQWLCIILSLTLALWPIAARPQSVDDNSSDVPLKSILRSIELEFEVGFIYESHIVKGKTSTYPTPTGQSLDQLLENLLKPLNLKSIAISKKTYVIKKIDPTTGQNMASGRVVSHNGMTPLPGVNVRIRGSESGTITDIEGKFKIPYQPDKEQILLFSYVGFQDLAIRSRGFETMEIVMKEDQTELQEVVVTAVGLDKNRKELGYSVQNISIEEVLESREANIASALSGKVSGVQIVSSSGAPGASASIRIRGNKSINSPNSPLFILDGMLISNTTSGNSSAGVDVSNRAIDINPHDIRKITILKGPAATVLYGSRAANGAIMITTKRGKGGRPSVVFSSEFGISQVNKLPPKQKLYAQGRPKNGVFTYRGPETGEVNSYGPLIAQLEFDGDSQYPYDSHGKLVARGQGNGLPARAYDDYESFWVNGIRSDQNLSVTGGSESVRYYFSLGNMSQSGIVPGTNFRRISLKSNLDFALTKKLSAGISTSFINSRGNRIQRGSNISGVTVGLYRNTPTFDIGNGKKGNEAFEDITTYQLDDQTQRAYRGNALYDNPFWVAAKIPYEDNVNRFIGSTMLSYDAFPWLTITSKLGFDTFTDGRDFAWDINSSSEPRGRVDQATRVSQRFNSDIYLLVDKQISEKIAFHGTLGHNYYSQHFETRNSTGRRLSVPGFYDISNAIDITSGRSIARSKLAGVYADASWTFGNFLFLHLAARNDWSSRLPQKDNSFFYSAASLGFEMVEALHIHSNFLSRSKLRISYGQVGNVPNIYQTQNSFSNAVIDGDNILASNEFPAFGANAFERNNIKGNENLKSELTSTLEVGGDFSFFQQKVNLDLTYYHAITTDALVTVTLPASTGFTSRVANSGEIKNQGYEISLSANLVNQHRFNWNLEAHFTRNRSMVKALAPGVDNVILAEFSNLSSLNVKGHPYGVFSGTRYQRNEQGRLIIGTDGFPLIDPEQGIIGDPNPDWLAGIGSQVSLGRFTLSMLWDIKMGGDVWNGTKGVLNYLGVSRESGDLRDVNGYIFDGVLENGDQNTIPVAFADPQAGLSNILWRRGGFLGVAEDLIEDGSWTRLRALNLKFSFPQHWTDKLTGFTAIDVSLYARNLILITDYSGIDPETNLRGTSNDQGWDFFNLPNTKSYGIVLRAQIN